jgi:hypothetical protein
MAIRGLVELVGASLLLVEELDALSADAARQDDIGGDATDRSLMSQVSGSASRLSAAEGAFSVCSPKRARASSRHAAI